MEQYVFLVFMNTIFALVFVLHVPWLWLVTKVTASQIYWIAWHFCLEFSFIHCKQNKLSGYFTFNISEEEFSNALVSHLLETDMKKWGWALRIFGVLYTVHDFLFMRFVTVVKILNSRFQRGNTPLNGSCLVPPPFLSRLILLSPIGSKKYSLDHSLICCNT